ncbi:hypothetical protein [Agarilytica rhodophyticola]|uniref:hypothetical protein n=1 Tax=Agarilytica rhodophyticola TaxID=1737490 RepID=UPI000B344962|nr:hypothetical protein [Agarilytica rhodophyticola]
MSLLQKTLRQSDTSSSKIVIFTDLDDSLIQTEGKLPSNAQTFLGATDRTGKPLSFFTQSQKALLAMFASANATVIPVTGRNTDALNRVHHDFNSYRVVSHGAVVLTRDGKLCQNWLGEIDRELSHWPELLAKANQEINTIISSLRLDARSRVIVDQDIPAYISVKGESKALAAIRQNHSLDHHFYRHENGRNHALMPPYARKKRAVEYLKKQMQLDDNDLIIGIGDSISDLDFMHACQFSMMPTNSQIVRDKL